MNDPSDTHPQPEDPAAVGEPGAHPPLADLPDNDPGTTPHDEPPPAPRDGPTPDMPPS